MYLLDVGALHGQFWQVVKFHAAGQHPTQGASSLWRRCSRSRHSYSCNDSRSKSSWISRYVSPLTAVLHKQCRDKRKRNEK